MQCFHVCHGRNHQKTHQNSQSKDLPVQKGGWVERAGRKGWKVGLIKAVPLTNFFFCLFTLPETNIAHENPIFPGKYHQNGGFSMATLVYRSVHPRSLTTSPLKNDGCLEDKPPFLLGPGTLFRGKLAVFHFQGVHVFFAGKSSSNLDLLKNSKCWGFSMFGITNPPRKTNHMKKICIFLSNMCIYIYRPMRCFVANRSIAWWSFKTFA